jgi:hypothetical protein
MSTQAWLGGESQVQGKDVRIRRDVDVIGLGFEVLVFIKNVLVNNETVIPFTAACFLALLAHNKT